MNKIKKTIVILISFCAIGCIFITGINLFMFFSTHEQFSKDIENADCILVLGAGVRNEKPTPMLNDRLEEAIKLYKNGKAPKIIMSGDHSQEDYDEVNVMKKFAIERGVPSSDIFMDHAGLSTYESLYRAKEIFQVKKVIIVTQDYHLYRSLFIANQLNMEAVGYPSNPRYYKGQIMREIREIVARCKDFLISFIQPKPTHLGETIPIWGDGNITNDKPI
ncbi:MAG: YdcF family protein [Erysipelotrichales bacterium]|nr:YdcF family protein [Erysipelotrichales bacterium]